ncbi:MAG TPA: phosphoglycerate kinase [Candidatus Paceibacterota bacterium]|nr:phosphoglycerate kinase [Candidatus Paceibacterota bacterium]
MLQPLNKAAFKNKRVLVRVDYNLSYNPESHKVGSVFRIEQTKKTIDYILKQYPQHILLLSHFGRPDKYSPDQSLRLFLSAISQTLKRKIVFLDYRKDISSLKNELKPGNIYLLDNLRFWPEENNNNSNFAKQLAKLGDVFVNEAFSVSHRRAASISAITKYLPAYKGFNLQTETETLDKFLHLKAKPFIIILGGAKIADKLDMLSTFIPKADAVLLGGGPANTLISQMGYSVGNSLTEVLAIKGAKLLANKKIILPIDWKVQRNGKVISVNLDKVEGKDVIVDIGPQTTMLYARLVTKAKKIFFNGPLGKSEGLAVAALGTIKTLQAIPHSCFALAGGGDTGSFVEQHKLSSKFKYLSTAGGATLAYLSGQTLPGLK